MSSIPPFETLLGKAPEWIQDTLPFEGDAFVAVDPSPDGEPVLTAFLVTLDDNLVPTIYLKSADWSDKQFDMIRDATPFDLDVVNLYTQQYRSRKKD